MRIHRRRRRMKRPSRNTAAKSVFIVILCIAVCVVLTVMFGNYLKDKAAATRPNESETTVSPETTAAPKTDNPTITAKNVEAGYLDLSAEAVEGKSAADVADEFFATSYTAASFALRDDNGSLLYTSVVASALGQVSASSLDIKGLVDILAERDVYTVGCFASAAFADGVTSEMYDVILSYETALVRELFEMGVDEILLTLLPVSGENMSETLSYIGAIKNAVPEGSRVGVSISHTILSIDETAQIMKELSGAVDFIALDMNGFEYDDAYEAMNSFVRENEMYISRYSMRILLGHLDAALLSRQIDALSVNAVYNWQIIK